MAVLVVNLAVVSRTIFLALLAFHSEMTWLHNGMLTADMSMYLVSVVLTWACAFVMLKMLCENGRTRALYNAIG